MKKRFLRIISTILVLIVMMTVVPLNGLTDCGLFTRAFAASNTIAWNSSYTSVSGSYDKVSLPDSNTTFYYGEVPYLNVHTGENVYVHDAYCYLYKDGTLYQTIHWKDQFSYNYFRYWGNPINDIEVGSYYFYYDLTYSTGSYSNSTATYTTDNYSFKVIDRTPVIYTSSSSVLLDLSGTSSATVNVWKSCNVSYQSYFQWNKTSDAFSCSWGEWTGGKSPLTITGKSTCSNEPITIKFFKTSDNSVIATTTIYVTITKPSYTVSYNANGGIGAPSSQTKNYNEELTLSSIIPTRKGYNFCGWGTSSGTLISSYQPSGSYTSNSGMTLYAIWKQDTLSSGSSDTAVVSYNEQEYVFKFTPSVSQNYVIYSTGSEDTKASLYDLSGNLIDENDDGGENTNFRLEKDLSAGSTYYYGVKYFSSSKTGNISVQFGPVYTISYNANGGSGAPSAQNKDWGKDITLSSTMPTRSGYNFVGWSTSSSATTAKYSSGANYSENGNVTLYAVWNAKPVYVVSYYPNGGMVSPTSVNVVSDSSTTLPTPTRTGYTFAGWYKDSSLTNYVGAADASFTPTSSVSLYAKWNINQYTITYDYKTNGGTALSSETQTFKFNYNSSVSLTPQATKNDWTFVGWNTDKTAHTALSSYTMPDKNVTLYAIYSKTLSANFYSGINKYTRETKNITIWNSETYGNITTPSSATSISGWTYLGWTTSTTAAKSLITSNNAAVSINATAGTVDFYALYSQTQTLTFNANGGSGVPSEISGTAYLNSSGNKNNINNTIPTTVPSKTGHTFAAWNTTSDGNGTDYQTGNSYTNSTQNDTLYARYTTNNYTVTYDHKTNGSDVLLGQTSDSVPYGSAVNLSVRAGKTGWSFVGWNTDKNATVGLTSYTMPAHNITLYAIYKKVLTANFVSGNPAKTSTNTYTIYNRETNHDFDIPTASSISGWTLKGWTEDKTATSSTVLVNGTSVGITDAQGTRTFYGLYTQTHTLTYNANGGSGAPSTESKTAYYNACGTQTNTSFTVSTIKPTRSGYNFLGWSTSSSATVATYLPGSGITLNENINLYAVWKYHTHEYKKTVIAPTCTAQGYTLNTCTICSSSYKSDYVEKKAHDYGAWMSRVAPTCIKTGSEIKYCKNCSEYETRTVPALGHNYKATIVAPTCSVQGYTLNMCTICSSSYKSDYVEKLPHQFENWNIVTSPTKEADGKGERVCSVCGAKDEIGFKFKEDNSTGVQLMFPYESEDETIKVTDETKTIGNIIKDIKIRKIYNITMLKDGEPIQPKGPVTVRIPIPKGFDRNKVCVYHIVNNETMECVELDKKIDGNDIEGYYVVFTTDHFSYFAIGEEVGKVNSVSVSDITLNYKASTTLKPTIKADSNANYTVGYSSSNTKVATVDKNGKVYAAGTGNATITCTVTDSLGNVVTDTCKVTVKYSFGQWLIKIFLFGWIWY